MTNQRIHSTNLNKIWIEYRRRPVTAWRALGVSLLGSALAMVLEPFVGAVSRVLTWPLSMGGFIVFAFEWYHTLTLPCPRCRKYFFSRSSTNPTRGNPFARRCMNCGLPKWAA